MAEKAQADGRTEAAEDRETRGATDGRNDYADYAGFVRSACEMFLGGQMKLPWLYDLLAPKALGVRLGGRLPCPLRPVATTDTRPFFVSAEGSGIQSFGGWSERAAELQIILPSGAQDER